MVRIRRFLLILIVIFFTSCSSAENNIVNNKSINNSTLLTLSFVDVGQGDSILIKTPKGRYILVDSGSKKEKEKFFEFLDQNNIKKFEVIIGTHPHEDHIGNMEELLKSYEANCIYMPRVSSNSETFRGLMEEIKRKKIKVKRAFKGEGFEIDGVKFKFYAPNKENYKDINNFSGVLKVDFGENSFMFMGDAEKLSEGEILKYNSDIRANIIKIGHHGSSSSSSKKFVKAVNPEYAVISCGKNNDYKHPHSETLRLLRDLNIKLYRTDLDGDIIFSSDGKKLNRK